MVSVQPYIFIISILLAFSLLSSCTNTPPPNAEPLNSAKLAVDALSSLMEGTFETAPDDPKDNFRDRRVRITSNALEGTWLYYQLNTGPEKKLYRQRLIRLSSKDDGSTVIQETYGLNSPDKFVDLWNNQSLLASISQGDFEPYFDKGCEQVWTKSDDLWTGYVNPKTCKIFSERRQSTISIEAEAQLTVQIYRQTERGYDETGKQLFGGTPGEFITLYRQAPH